MRIVINRKMSRTDLFGFPETHWKKPVFCHRRQHAGPQLRGPGSEQQMNRRLQLNLDSGGLALCGGGRGPVLPAGGRLIDERHDDRPACHRCPGDGDLAAGKAPCVAPSLRSQQPVHQRAVPAADGRSWRHLLDEPVGQLLGQCRDEELLLLAEDRAHGPQGLSDKRRCQGRCVRLH